MADELSQKMFISSNFANPTPHAMSAFPSSSSSTLLSPCLQSCLDRFQTEHGDKVSGTVEEHAGSVRDNHSQSWQCSDCFNEEREPIVRKHDELIEIDSL
jgi:hypothetical protein